MPRSDAKARRASEVLTDGPGRTTRRRVDWRGWLALAWAAWFGVLYARMVVDERAPGVRRAIERAAGPIRTWCK